MIKYMAMLWNSILIAMYLFMIKEQDINQLESEGKRNEIVVFRNI